MYQGTPEVGDRERLLFSSWENGIECGSFRLRHMLQGEESKYYVPIFTMSLIT